MGKPVANTNCIITVTIDGGPLKPMLGPPVIVTLPAATVKAGGFPAYSGFLTVRIPIIPSVLEMVLPPLPPPPEQHVISCVIAPTGTSKIEGKLAVRKGDTSVAIPWAGTIPGDPPIASTGMVTVTVTDAGQETVMSA